MLDDEYVYKFGKLTRNQLLAPSFPIGLPWLMKEAIRHQGTKLEKDIAEGPNIFHRYAFYDAEKNEVRTNSYGCPMRHSHHAGETCSCCGQEG